MTEDFFAWNNSYIGGTEVALKWFHKNVLPEMKNLKNYRCISVPGKPTILENVLDNSKKNILWLHLTPNQVDDNGMNVLQMTDFKKTLHKVIAISNFQKEFNETVHKIFIIKRSLDFTTIFKPTR